MSSSMLGAADRLEPLSADDADWDGHRPSMWARLRRRPSFWVGAAGVVLLAAAAIFAPVITSADPVFQFREVGRVGPGSGFPLGTDALGRDYLSRLLHGGRTSLTVGVLATAMAMLVGAAVGGVAAMTGNVHLRLPAPFARRVTLLLPVEALLMRLTDAVLAFPALLVALAVAAVARPSVPLVTLIIGGFLWTSMARIVYARIASLREREFVLAARALGVSPLRTLVRHVMPHTGSLLVAYAGVAVAGAIVFEATLSYLGVGVPPPAPSWGSMIAEHRSYYASDPRLLLVPGVALMLTILSFNLLADALRDALDPRLVGDPSRSRR